MKAKFRLAGIYLFLHLAASSVIWGGLCVYQRCHNTMNREQIAVASVTTTQQHTEIQILENQWSIPSVWMAQDSPLYYAAYVLTGESVHIVTQIISIIC